MLVVLFELNNDVKFDRTGSKQAVLNFPSTLSERNPVEK